MTGEEILQEEFERAGMRGYKAEQVDAYLRKIASYVDEQDQQITDLKYKIQILADKIEEYKADEENIRDALLGAQKLGASVLNEAKAKAETITREAVAASEEMVSQAKAKAEFLTKESIEKANIEISELRKQCNKERKHLEAMKREVSNFKAALLKQYKSHLDLLSNLPTVSDKTEEEKEEQNNENKDSASYSANKTSSNDSIVAKQQTISSDITSSSNEIDEEEMEQTKEFHHNSTIYVTEVDDENDNNKENNENTTSTQKKYIERFGELKFGSHKE